jgi:hypothetical protein
MTRLAFTALSIQEANTWSPKMIAEESICWALPAVMGSLGLRGLGFFGVRLDLGLGRSSRVGQNSMVMVVVLRGCQ